MDSQSYHIKWFPQVCIDSVENAPMLTPDGITKPGSGMPDGSSEVLEATVRVSASSVLVTYETSE